MPKLNQRGVVHIFLILFLLTGLAVGVYLVKQKTNILPKAYEPNRIGIGSTAPIGIGSTAPAGISPAKPVNLEGKCYTTPGYKTGTTAVVTWTPGDGNPNTIYFVRYKKPVLGGIGGWWPSDPSDSDSRNIFPGLQLAAQQGQEFNVWGVYACNVGGGCTDFVRGEAFDCLNPIPAQGNIIDYANVNVPDWGANIIAPPIPLD